MTKAALLTIEELSASSRYSVVQLRRLARAGRIPFFQPGGKGGKLWFPPDAIERAGEIGAVPPNATASMPSAIASPSTKPGPKAKWRKANAENTAEPTVDNRSKGEPGEHAQEKQI